MAQQLKSLLYKSKDWGWDPQSPCKRWVGLTCNDSSEVRDGDLQIKSARQICWRALDWAMLSLWIKRAIKDDFPHQPRASTHAHMCTRVHTYAPEPAQVCPHTCKTHIHTQTLENEKIFKKTQNLPFDPLRCTSGIKSIHTLDNPSPPISRASVFLKETAH